jgi:hypothetical protein
LPLQDELCAAIDVSKSTSSYKILCQRTTFFDANTASAWHLNFSLNAAQRLKKSQSHFIVVSKHHNGKSFLSRHHDRCN